MLRGTIIDLDQVNSRDGYCGRIFELIKPHNSAAKLVSCVLAHILPGMSTLHHHHTSGEEIYFVVSGTGIIQLENKTSPIHPGFTVHIPPGASHVVENTGTTVLSLFVVNTPPYDPDQVVFEQGAL